MVKRREPSLLFTASLSRLIASSYMILNYQMAPVSCLLHDDVIAHSTTEKTVEDLHKFLQAKFVCAVYEINYC